MKKTLAFLLLKTLLANSSLFQIFGFELTVSPEP
jgi:hypothetical protein